MLTFEPMNSSHLDAVMQIQAHAYPATMQERRELFAARLNASPAHCWIATDAQGPCGYLFSYPSLRGHITPLNGIFKPHPGANCLYVHDLAVAARASGQGIGPRLVAFCLAQSTAQQLGWSTLVSVQGSSGFWQRLGYADAEPSDPQQRMHLASYPVAARYMERALS